MECHEDAEAVQARKALDLDCSFHLITPARRGVFWLVRDHHDVSGMYKIF